MNLNTLYEEASKWVNDNQGAVSIAIFIITIALGWVSGIFSALRRKPKFKLALSVGPTFCCTYPIGDTCHEDEEHEATRTGIALYVTVANIGSAPSSIESIFVGYHWHLAPFSIKWLKYSVGWFWLKNQSVALEDFQVKIGENTKVYPFLTQKSHLSKTKADTYLKMGCSANGVVYFEQSDSWGGCFPTVQSSRVRIKVRVYDTFGRKYTKAFWIPSVTLEEARMYNPAFGKTLAELHGESLPFDNDI